MHKKSSSNSKINDEFLEALRGLRIHFFGVSNFHAWCVHAEFILLRIISDSFICIKVMNVSNKSVEGFLFQNRWFTERSTEVNCTHIEQLSRRDQFQRRNIQDWHWGRGWADPWTAIINLLGWFAKAKGTHFRKDQELVQAIVQLWNLAKIVSIM